MYLKANKFKIFLIIICLATLAISLTQVAFVNEGSEGIVSEKGWSYFFMGSIVIIGGGTFEWLIWLANPISLYAIILLLKNKKSTIKFSLTAFLIALSFTTWQKILISESGKNGKIISLELGYYLWLSSIFLLLIGSIYHLKTSKIVEKLDDFEQWNMETFGK